MYYRTETIDPRYDLRFGQLSAKTEIIYRCDGCVKKSNNELEVRSIFWNRDAFRNFCSTDCANRYAEDKYEKGISPCSYSEEKRYVFEYNFKSKYVFEDHFALSKDEMIQATNWLIEIFNQYDALFQKDNREWYISSEYKSDYIEVIQQLRQKHIFDFSKEAHTIYIANKIKGLFWCNGIDLRDQLKSDNEIKIPNYTLKDLLASTTK
jgi:hypothetical protein